MISSTDFDNLIYKEPRLVDKRPKLQKIVGMDSEAYSDGRPMMICTSYGHCIEPENIVNFMFEEHPDEYVFANIVLFNMKYDGGAILYHLKEEDLRTLWAENVVKVKDTVYSYIPHKRLMIKRGIKMIKFWDIHQFYKSSLQKAAQKYLDKKKLDINTKSFSEKYAKRFRKAITKYCIQDAVLARDLGIYFIDKLEEFGITATAIFSCASISFKYFCDNSSIVTSYRFWEHCPELLKYATDAYEGGKFEVTQRGKFTGYEYDLASAYPFEIANLKDITYADVIESKTYRRDALYGFIRVHIVNRGAHLPCGIMRGNVRIYPAGEFFLTITKEEYMYLSTLPEVTVTHLHGYYLFVNKLRYPYRDPINYLFELKSRYKGKDAMLYSNSKIVMNSFYGKTCQVTKRKEDGMYMAGAGWNPVYASVITANTRIKVCQIQNLMKDNCLAVHTDSVITSIPLPVDVTPGKLGEFEFVDKGDGVLIACGMYQLNTLCAYKGFAPNRNKVTNQFEDWTTILKKYPNRSKIPYWQLHVQSWVEAMAKNHHKDDINVFSREKKDIDLNCDTKRVWPSLMKSKDFLNRTEKSVHKNHVETEPPKFWQKNI